MFCLIMMYVFVLFSLMVLLLCLSYCDVARSAGLVAVIYVAFVFAVSL